MTALLRPLEWSGLQWAQMEVAQHHYLHRPVDSRCSVEGYAVHVAGIGRIGCLLFGRPEATRCRDWYGSVDDVLGQRTEVTRWQVLNLARVWLDPRVQRGGIWYGPQWLPGYVDRRGEWRSTLASEAIRQALARVGFDYLMRRPPCFLDEPYEIRWCLSYCDTSRHRGTIYRAAGFERYSVNSRGIETWRIRLPALTPEQDAAVRARAGQHPRSRRYRAARAVQAEQLKLV